MGPRDGLQAIDRVYDTGTKAAMIERMLAAGVKEVEAASFVHPKVVPQLADAEALLERLPRLEEVRYRGLVPNRKGAERAVAAGVDVMVGLMSASETYSRRNQNMSIGEGLQALEQVAEVAREAGTPWVASISMAFFSPWEGYTPPATVLNLIERALPLGPAQVSLAATTGMAGPGRVASLCRLIRQEWPDLPLALHLHNGNGMALANALAGLQAGVAGFDASICGIGGGIVLPKGNYDTGNIPTEDLVCMLTDLGVDPGLQPGEVIEAARDVAGLLELDDTGFTARTGTPEELVERYRG
ncbi:MAG: hydroxymethylglutaryl-CoA lyase [Actinomycetota bacterium]|nr:hydroxymethylglutaryl-CoA lyase [Actinomycetota bacterium]